MKFRNFNIFSFLSQAVSHNQQEYVLAFNIPRYKFSST